MSQKSLAHSEWILVSSLLILFFSLFLVAKITAYRSQEIAFSLAAKDFVVTFEGAVAKPGSYSVAEGTLLGDVLRKARPRPEADLSGLPLQDRVDKSLRFTVPELKEIVVTVKGAVQEERTVTLPLKSRLCDLRGKVFLTTEADKAFFRRKKRLKNGEIIEVPKKTVE